MRSPSIAPTSMAVVVTLPDSSNTPFWSASRSRSHSSEPPRPKSAENATKRPLPLRRATGTGAQLQFSRSPEGPTVTSDVSPVPRSRTYRFGQTVGVGRIEIRRQ